MIENIEKILKIITDIIIIIAAGWALFKFFLIEIFQPRLNLDMKVEQQHIEQNKEKENYIICTYIIENKGQFPIYLSCLSLKIYKAQKIWKPIKDSNNLYKINNEDIGYLKCEEDKQVNKELYLIKRNFDFGNKHKDLQKLRSGDKSLFPIRFILKSKDLEPALFIYGSFEYRRFNFNIIKPTRGPQYHHMFLITNNTNKS